MAERCFNHDGREATHETVSGGTGVVYPNCRECAEQNMQTSPSKWRWRIVGSFAWRTGPVEENKPSVSTALVSQLAQQALEERAMAPMFKTMAEELADLNPPASEWPPLPRGAVAAAFKQVAREIAASSSRPPQCDCDPRLSGHHPLCKSRKPAGASHYDGHSGHGFRGPLCGATLGRLDGCTVQFDCVRCDACKAVCLEVMAGLNALFDFVREAIAKPQCTRCGKAHAISNGVCLQCAMSDVRAAARERERRERMLLSESGPGIGANPSIVSLTVPAVVVGCDDMGDPP